VEQPRHYIGCKQVVAWPEERDGRPGYAVRYEGGYESWSPKEPFEKAYLAMEYGSDGSKVTEAMVKDFIRETECRRVGKTTIVHALLANGFEVVESSACVDAKNYDHDAGVRLCMQRIEARVWTLLGFLLQCARTGVKE
jgi:hypothetical protein